MSKSGRKSRTIQGMYVSKPTSDNEQLPSLLVVA